MNVAFLISFGVSAVAEVGVTVVVDMLVQFRSLSDWDAHPSFTPITRGGISRFGELGGG